MLLLSSGGYKDLFGVQAITVAFTTFAGSWKQFGWWELGGRLLELVAANPLALFVFLIPLAAV